MDALKHYALDDLALWAKEERLIDACFRLEQHTVLVLGELRVTLSHERAHAFLRGVLAGMGHTWRRFDLVLDYYLKDLRQAQAARTKARVPAKTQALQLAKTFRDLDVLSDQWRMYRASGYPLGHAHAGLVLWSRFATHTTTS